MGRCWRLRIFFCEGNCLEISSRLHTERHSKGCGRLSRDTVPRISVSKLSNVQFFRRPTLHPFPRSQMRGSYFGRFWQYLRTDSAALDPLSRRDSCTLCDGIMGMLRSCFVIGRSLEDEQQYPAGVAVRSYAKKSEGWIRDSRKEVAPG